MKIWKNWESYVLQVKRQNSAGSSKKLKYKANIPINFMPRYISKSIENTCLYQNLDRMCMEALFIRAGQSDNRVVRQ